MLLKETSLPKDLPQNIIVSPSMNRWGDANGEPGHLPKMLNSVISNLSRDGELDRSLLLVSDASGSGPMQDARLKHLGDILRTTPLATVYLMTPETQSKVVDMIRDMVKIDKRIITAILQCTGYASQRAKLDAVVAGAVLNSGQSKKILTLDDDTIVPDERINLRVEEVNQKFQRLENSQTLLAVDPEPKYFDKSPNSLDSFFNSLGHTLPDAEKVLGRKINATYGQHDTMHGALEKVLESGITQFEVRENENALENADRASIVAAIATKYLVPDYRTVRIAKASLEEEFPDREVNISSYPSGPNRDFAFQRSWTNVDSACMSRFFSEATALLPWWFISDLDTSKENPLKVVTAHYRADNEFLPVLLTHIQEKTGQNFVYHGGIDTQVSHHRARTGYRPDIVEQATASLVGNVAALEAIKYIDFSTARPRFKEFDRNSFLANVDEPKIFQVFTALQELGEVCEKKSKEIEARRLTAHNAPAQKMAHDLLGKYEKVYELLDTKTDGFHYHNFKESILNEVYNQLVFYSKVLEAFPTVVDAISKIVAKGEYPIMRATNE